MAYTPLAQSSDLQASPLVEVFRDITAHESALLTRASRSIEAICERRLTPFTITESSRADTLDIDDDGGDIGGPVQWAASLAQSRSRALGGDGGMVRHLFLREYPPQWADLWVGALVAVWSDPALAGSFQIPLPGIQYEPDTGHVRLSLGTYVPTGSTLRVTYSGGYNPVPDDLIQASLYAATEMALIELTPEKRGDVDVGELRSVKDQLLAPYMREQP